MFITVRNVVANVIFLHVRHPVHGGGEGGQADTPLGRETPPPQQADTPPPRDGHCSGRYASYRNAFLYLFICQASYKMLI